MQLLLTASRRRRLIAVLGTASLLAVAAIVGIASATTGQASRSHPTLRMTRLNPLTVAGRGFEPHRRVIVRLLGDQTQSRRPVANRAGAFTVQFPVVVDRCSGFTVTARQQNSVAVVLRSPARPACAPA
jgi:hypothetical protein